MSIFDPAYQNYVNENYEEPGNLSAMVECDDCGYGFTPGEDGGKTICDDCIENNLYWEEFDESILRHYGQYKYYRKPKAVRPEWRVLDYLECMRDWSDPVPWMFYYQDAIRFYIQVLNREIDNGRHS